MGLTEQVANEFRADAMQAIINVIEAMKAETAANPEATHWSAVVTQKCVKAQELLALAVYGINLGQYARLLMTPGEMIEELYQ